MTKKKPFKFFWEDDRLGRGEDTDRMFSEMHDKMMETFRRMASGTPDITIGIGAAFPVDVTENENDIIVRADLPGVDKKSVNIRTEGRLLEISAAQSRETREAGKNFLRQERHYGEFHRILTLPADVDGTRAKANIDNGVLEIKLPKVKKTKRT